MIALDTDTLRSLLFAAIVGRTNVTDLSAGGEAADFLESWVQLCDAIADGIWEVRDAALLNGATGDDLTVLCRDRGVERDLGARAMGGAVHFGRSTTTSLPELTIPAGTPVLRLADRFRYVTVEDATLAAEALWSGTVALVATQKGTAGNCGAGEISALGSGVPGVTLVANTTAITTGTDAESDESLRDRTRRHLRALGRAVASSLLEAAFSATTDDQRKVRFASLSTIDEATPGIGTLWIDDGTGDCETSADYAVSDPEVLLPEACGGETVLYLKGRPVKAPPAIEVADEPVPYTLQKPYGRVILGTAMTAGQRAVAGQYSAYTGLVAAVQTAIDGLVSSPQTNPGVVAYGVILSVRGARRVGTNRGDNYLPIAANLIFAEGVDSTAGLAEAETVLLTAINSLPIHGNGVNGSLAYNYVVKVLMGVTGVVDVQNLLIDGVANGKTATEGCVIRSIAAALDLS